MHRKRAALLLRADAGQREAAEADLRRALEIARSQESPALQLRAARDLARLLAERGERQQAFDLLAPIHDWFGKEPKASTCRTSRSSKVLLDELRQ